jgi:hypothetical protein
MQRTPASTRTSQRLSDSLLRHLNLYALGASASGVSLLALTPSALAEIVYTKTHQVIGANGIYDLDLTHNGVVNFVIREWSATTFSNNLLAKGALENSIAGTGKYAAALRDGATIGAHRRFIAGQYSSPIMFRYYYYCSISCRKGIFGNWKDVNNRYLGLKFKIKGETHYGWARLTVNNIRTDITATLTGYAYETVPGKSIRAGQTKEDTTDVHTQSQTSPSASLGDLALGARSPLSGRQP